MATQRCYYETLGVSRTASSSEIAVSYRKLAVKYHPDKNPGDEEAIAAFKECSEAFEVLNDPNKRSRYDQFGHAGVNGQGHAGSGFSDVEDIFSAFGDVFGDIFGGRGGGRGGGSRRRVRKGRDVRCDVTLTLHEAAEGVCKTVEFQRQEPCQKCEGTGAADPKAVETCSYCGGHGQVIQQAGIVRMQTTCPSCHGAGKTITKPCGVCKGKATLLKNVEADVDIPAGIDTDMQIRITAEGEPSASGGPPGDCYCVVTVEEHELFDREGQHLICRVPITYPQAVLGCQLEVPTLDGRDEVTIPPGTQHADVFTLRGEGMRDPRVSGRGDLHVQVLIDVPTKVSDEQEIMLRELAELEHTQVAPKRKSFLDKMKQYFIHETAIDDAV
ncbi:molecular chaperone DnaJ [Adhaeretor mobilis]|uniref:Chaperone protein DnaJ n=1 Tax=Adhaeretor mobilis TaxID=1930276 RepID=A0A517MVL4_9BACT|nr:molecular chaperone DnaJ [Adhaeretor mobilis]QDS98920.1 Chaperone protein DnaJ [Adhaeretor mobilis]